MLNFASRSLKNGKWQHKPLLALFFLSTSAVMLHAGVNPSTQPPESEVSAQNTSALLLQQANFAFNLITALDQTAKNRGSNIVMSPASLMGVYDLLDQGADVAMRKGLMTSLGLDLKVKGAETTFGRLQSAERDNTTNQSESVRGANKLILDPTIKPYPIVEKVLGAAHAEIESANLRDPEVISRINAWVNEKTSGRIQTVLDGPISNPGLVALNALYFKAKWQYPFKKTATKSAYFTTAASQTIPVTMMHLPTARYAFRNEAHFIGGDLAFEDERFHLTFVTTDDKPHQIADFKDAAVWLSGSGFEQREGDIAMPRLDLHQSGNLLPALDLLGLRVGRKSPTALAGFAPGIELNEIIQKVVFKADEEGAEAAAVTAATASRSFEGKALHLSLDKPFLFALRDEQTGLILMAGYVGAPEYDRKTSAP